MIFLNNKSNTENVSFFSNERLAKNYSGITLIPNLILVLQQYI